jgi:hypothetical protein
MANRRAYRPDRHVYRTMRMNTIGRRRGAQWAIVIVAIVLVIALALGLRWFLRG